MRIAIGLLLWCLLTVGGAVWGWHVTNTPGNDFAMMVTFGGMVWGFVFGCVAFVMILCCKPKSKKIDEG